MQCEGTNAKHVCVNVWEIASLTGEWRKRANDLSVLCPAGGSARLSADGHHTRRPTIQGAEARARHRDRCAAGERERETERERERWREGSNG